MKQPNMTNTTEYRLTDTSTEGPQRCFASIVSFIDEKTEVWRWVRTMPNTGEDVEQQELLVIC